MNYDHTHPDVGRYEYVVRDVAEPDLGIRAHDGPEPGLKSRGSGDLRAQARDEIERRLDLEAYVGEHVATVFIDVGAWEYSIYWEVEPPINQRVRDFVDRFTRGERA